MKRKVSRNRLFAGSSALAAALMFAQAVPAYAQEQTYSFDIPAQDLGSALREFARESGQQVTFDGETVRGKRTPSVRGSFTARAALNRLLANSGLTVRQGSSGVFIVQRGSATTQTTNDEPARAAPEETETQIIIVTGTNIRGTAPVGSPLQQFDREDIDKTGAASVQEFFEKGVPQNFGGGVSDVQNGGVGTILAVEDGTAINLRGLGNGSTLVLLNGNRLAASGNGTYVDTSMIPLSAVERIDILADGASAIYGSEAVSGVVNILLRDDFDGAETRLRYGSVTDGGQQEYRASQTFGKTWSSGNALITYDFRDRSALLTDEREFTETAPGPSTLIPEQKSHSVLGVFSQDLSGSTNFSINALYSDRTYATIFDNGFRIATTEGDTQQLNIAGGFNFDMGSDWSAELSASYSQADSFNVEEQEAIGFARDNRGRTNTFTIDGQLSGPLFQLPAGVVQSAFGVQFRNENLESQSTTTFGGIVRPPSTSAFKRDVFAGFGEIIIPLIAENNRSSLARKLAISLAGRVESYSDFGSTFDPKIGLQYEPFEGWTLRGSYGTSFRAPLLIQIGSPAFIQAINSRFYPDPTSPTGFSPFILLQGGNPDLQEETSKNWTVGIDIEPPAIPRLRINLTYFDIGFTNRIQAPATGAASFQILADSQFDEFVTRNPSVAIINELFADPNFANFGGLSPSDITAIADNRTNNIAGTDLNGLDFSVSYGFETSIGQFDLQSAGSYYFNYENRLTATSEAVDIVDTVFNPVDLQLRNTIAWSKNGFGSAISMNYVDSYLNNIGNPQIPVDSWTTFDLQFSYSTPNNSNGLFKDVRLSLNVSNLFDTDPPFVDTGRALFFDGANASPQGRFISFEVVKAW